MPPDLPAEHQAQVAAFYRKHRTGLVTVLFTDLVDSVALIRQLGDQAGATFLQQRRQIARQTPPPPPSCEILSRATELIPSRTAV